jgi:hypothetical protein
MMKKYTNDRKYFEKYMQFVLIIIIFTYCESRAGIELNMVKINKNTFSDSLNGRMNKEVYYRVVNGETWSRVRQYLAKGGGMDL